MRRSGWRACTVATAFWSAVAAWLTSATLPGTSNVTRALRPSFDTSDCPPADSGLRMPAAYFGRADSAAATSLAACRMLAFVRERDAGGPGLDQHGLGVSVVLRGRDLVQDALGLPGLPGVVLRKLPRADRLARHEDGGDQQQPAEDRGLAVSRAPPGDALGDRRPAFGVAVRHHGVLEGILNYATVPSLPLGWLVRMAGCGPARELDPHGRDSQLGPFGMGAGAAQHLFGF